MLLGTMRKNRALESRKKGLLSSDILKHLEEVYTAVEDKHVEPIRWFIDGDEAAVDIESTGKQVGPFFGVQGKARQFKISGVHLFKTRDGLIEHWRPVWNADHLKRMLA